MSRPPQPAAASTASPPAPSTSTPALEACLEGCDPEGLVRAAGMVIGSSIPSEPEHAAAIAELTGCTCELDA